MNERDLKIITQTVKDVDRAIGQVIANAQFLTVSGKTAQLRDEAIAILTQKQKLLNEAETIKDVKKVLRVRTILENADAKK